MKKMKRFISVSKLTLLNNIGEEIENKLKSVGISSAEELIQLGSKEAFFCLKIKFPNVCLVHLYTLQGAIDNFEYNQLLDKEKYALKSFNDNLK